MNPLEAEEQRITISSDGHKLAAALTGADTQTPLIVFAHGFGGDKNEKGLFLSARDYLCGSGFSVLRFDFRCCGENSGSFRDVRVQDLVSDLQNVFGYIRESPALSGRAIGFVGFSLGAGLGILAGIEARSFVFWSPAIYTETDMAPRYETPEIASERAKLGYMRKGLLDVGDQFIEDLKSGAIGDRLSTVHCPTLMIHGDADQRIPFASSVRAIKALSETNRRCRLRKIPGADHAFRNGRQTREWLFSATAEWFSKCLRPAKQSRRLQQTFAEFERERLIGDNAD